MGGAAGQADPFLEGLEAMGALGHGLQDVQGPVQRLTGPVGDGGGLRRGCFRQGGFLIPITPLDSIGMAIQTMPRQRSEAEIDRISASKPSD